MKKIFCLTILAGILVSFAVAALGESVSPFPRVKAMAMTKGKLVPVPGQSGGKTYSYSVVKNDVKYVAECSVDKTSEETISISQQIKNPEDRPGSFTGKKMTVQFGPRKGDEKAEEKGGKYQLGVDDPAKGSTKWSPVNWNIAWGVADKFLKTMEGN